jgi:hypothetical protein
MAEWEHYNAGTDLRVLDRRDAEAEDDPTQRPARAANRRKTLRVNHLPTNQGVFADSCASVVHVGPDGHGFRSATRILPLMKCRSGIRHAA